MHITNAARTGLVGLATAGAALTIGATVPSAQAATRPTSAVSPTATAATRATPPPAVHTQARWITLYHGKNTPSGIWTTPAVKSKAKVFQVASRCWTGNGPVVRAYITIWRKSGPFWRSVHSYKKLPCNGRMNYSRITNAKAGTKYHATIQLSKRRTIEVWLQNYG